MQEQNDLSAANHELINALKSLPAAGIQIDPVAAAFAAGRRSAQPNVRLWKATALVALVVGAGSHLVTRRPQPAMPAQAPSPTMLATYQPTPISNQSVFALQRAVQERGLDGLPTTITPSERPVRAKDFF